MNFIANFTDRFYLNFIKDDRWLYIADGLKVTLTVTFFSVLIGIVLGFIIALIRATYDRTEKNVTVNVTFKPSAMYSQRSSFMKFK